MDEWGDWARRARGNSDDTLRTYERELDALSKYAKTRGWSPVGDLTWKQVGSYLHSRGGGDNTAARRWSALQSYYRFLVEKNRRPDNPIAKVRRPRPAPSSPKPVFDVTDRIDKLAEPYKSIALLISETGMTIREVLSIDLRDQFGNEIRVDGPGGRERPVPLTKGAQAALRRLGKQLPDDWSMSARTIQRRLEEAGLTALRLRQTVVAELAERGNDVATIQALLGHRSSGTARAYVAAFGKPVPSDRLREALERRRGGR